MSKVLKKIEANFIKFASYPCFFFRCSNSYGHKEQHYGTKYDHSHIDSTIKKVGQYADAQEQYKKQHLNVKYSYDAVPTEYDYVEKYGWGKPTTIGSLYTGYGYGHQYPQQYEYGQHDSYGYKKPSYGHNSYGYKKPSYDYGYKPEPYGYKKHEYKKPHGYGKFV